LPRSSEDPWVHALVSDFFVDDSFFCTGCLLQYM
jgi:hypothetical protein